MALCQKLQIVRLQDEGRHEVIDNSVNYLSWLNQYNSLHGLVNLGWVWFGLVRFYGISTIGGYLMPYPLYTYIYIKYIEFGLVWVYALSTILDYLMPNPLYTYVLNI